MENNMSIMLYDLNVFIVKYGNGSKVISLAKECGIPGGTVILGKGTAKNSILKFFELDQSEKEIVLVLSNRISSCLLLDRAAKQFEFHKPNRGICFSVSVASIIGTKGSFGEVTVQCDCESEGENKTMIKSIFVIVDRGKAEVVVDAATKAGARGGTIINARGSGIHETSKIFSMEIEPEKEIVMILSESEIADKICENIRKEIKIDEPGNGIMFVQNVNKAYGLY